MRSRRTICGCRWTWRWRLKRGRGFEAASIRDGIPPQASIECGSALHEDIAMKLTFNPRRALAFAIISIAAVAHAGDSPSSKVKVTIQDEKPVVVEAALPVDPTPRVRYSASGLSAQIRTEQNQSLHLSHFPMLNIDGRAMQPGQMGGQFLKNNAFLPNTPGGRKRQGFQTVFVIDDLRITLTAEDRKSTRLNSS